MISGHMEKEKVSDTFRRKYQKWSANALELNTDVMENYFKTLGLGVCVEVWGSEILSLIGILLLTLHVWPAWAMVSRHVVIIGI